MRLHDIPKRKNAVVELLGFPFTYIRQHRAVMTWLNVSGHRPTLLYCVMIRHTRFMPLNRVGRPASNLTKRSSEQGPSAISTSTVQ
eukprot:scaffold15662_cov60-Attheya_sp.AAC.1